MKVALALVAGAATQVLALAVAKSADDHGFTPAGFCQVSRQGADGTLQQLAEWGEPLATEAQQCFKAFLRDCERDAAEAYKGYGECFLKLAPAAQGY